VVLRRAGLKKQEEKQVGPGFETSVAPHGSWAPYPTNVESGSYKSLYVDYTSIMIGIGGTWLDTQRVVRGGTFEAADGRPSFGITT